MFRRDDGDNFLGSEDDFSDVAGDELDLAEAVGRANPTADQLQHFANLRGIKHAQLDRQAPFVRNTPPSALKGSLGNQVLLQTGQTVQVAAWNGDDSETLPVTISAFPVNPTEQTINISSAIRPYAIVQYGTKGSLAIVEVDLGRGFQFTVGASMVTLRLVLDTGPVTFPNTPDPTLLVGGMVSFHPIVRTQNITRTLYAENANAVTVFKLPNFTKSINVLKKNWADVGTLYLYDSATVQIGEVTIAANSQQLLPIEVPDDAVIATFHAGAGHDVVARLICNLDL